MNGKLSRGLISALASVVCAGCISVYHVAEKPPPDGDGIYMLATSGSDTSLGPDFANGRDPRVAPDGSLLFVKPVPHANGSSYYQVFRGSMPLTTSAGDKRNPVAGLLNVAFVHDVPGQGKQIVVQNPAGAALLQFASDANGLAFFDGGSKLLFSQRDGVYWISASGGNSATRVVDCSAVQPQGCGPVAVSHNGQYLGYYHYVTLAPMRLAWIEVIKTNTWQPVLRITPNTFCPACVAGQPGSPADLGSFDFSPDDQWIYATVRLAGPPGTPADRALQEIYRVKLDLGASVPSATQPERLTNNGHADYHPSTGLSR